MSPADALLLTQAAAAAAGGQQYPPGTLYMVATPIGNLADLSLRALHVLALVDLVACEDTRVSGQLIRHLGLATPLLALHQHNEREAAQGVVARLAAGGRVAYISDAGTPALSDPGAALVAAAHAAGHRVVPIPGASSALAALSVAGDTIAQGFVFVGFLPPRASDRRATLDRVAADARAQVLFEAPHRIERLVDELAQAAPQRRATLCRELTKQFETVATMTCVALPAWISADANRLRGEFVLVLHASEVPTAAPEGVIDAAAERMLTRLLQDLPLKQAVQVCADLSGAPRNALYTRALALRASGPAAPG